MQIVILGAGGIGYTLAQKLVKEKHELIIIEKDPETAKKARNNLDAIIIENDGANPEVLLSALEEKTDAFLALTNNDSVNILSGLLAKKFGVEKIVIRINQYQNLANPLVKAPEIKLINPDLSIARGLIRLITTPPAEEVEILAKGKVKILKLTVGTEIAGKSIKDIEFPKGWIIVGHITETGFSIPHGNTLFSEGDKILVLGDPSTKAEIEKVIGLSPEKLDLVVLLGAEQITSYISGWLERRNIPVRIIESNIFKAKEFAQKSTSLILRGDITSEELFSEANVKEANYFAALTKDDEINIIACSLAKEAGAKHVISLCRKPHYFPLTQKIGIDTVIMPYPIISEEIHRYLKKKRALALIPIENEQAQIWELKLTRKSKVIRKSLSSLKLPEQLIVGAIVRNEQLIIPGGETRLLPEDRVIIISLPGQEKIIEKLF